MKQEILIFANTAGSNVMSEPFFLEDFATYNHNTSNSNLIELARANRTFFWLLLLLASQFLQKVHIPGIQKLSGFFMSP